MSTNTPQSVTTGANSLKRTVTAVAEAGRMLEEINIPDGIAIVPAAATSLGAGAGFLITEVFLGAVFWALRVIVTPCEVVLRHKIGERYFGPFLPAATLGAFYFGSRTETFHENDGYALLGIFVFCFVGQWLARFVRDRDGRYWHSYSEGEPHLKVPAVDSFLSELNFTWKFSDFVLEPLALLGLCAFIYWQEVDPDEGGWIGLTYWHRHFHISAGLYLGVAAVAPLIYRFLMWRELKHRLLDELDAGTVLEARTLAREVPNLQQSGFKYHRGVAYLPKQKRYSWAKDKDSRLPVAEDVQITNATAVQENSTSE